MNITLANSTKRCITSLMVVSLFSTLPLAANADMVNTTQVVEHTRLAAERSSLQTLVQREDIASYLKSQGVSPEAVSMRINNLTESEVRDFQQQLDQLPAGEGFLGGVIAILVIFMLLDMAGVTDIFPRI